MKDLYRLANSVPEIEVRAMEMLHRGIPGNREQKSKKNKCFSIDVAAALISSLRHLPTCN